MPDPIRRVVGDKCDRCPRVEELAAFGDQRLCYDCWHAARESTPPYHVRSVSNPTSFLHSAGIPVVYTREEAISRALERGGDYEPVPAASWTGGRPTHPAFLSRRRAQIEASLAEREQQAPITLTKADVDGE